MTAEELHQRIIDTLAGIMENGTAEERLTACSIAWNMLDSGIPAEVLAAFQQHQEAQVTNAVQDAGI